MEKEIAKIGINYSDSTTLEIIKNTVAKGATPEEFHVFVEMCKSTGLNPFKKEVWFLKINGQVQSMTGINGFYTIANNHPQFDGIEAEIVEKDGKIEKAVAKVYRKDRKIPMTSEAYWVEYQKPHGNWKIMPRVMLSKCAESMALRKAFPQELNGLYTQEEMPAEFAVQNVAVKEVSTVENVKVKTVERSGFSQPVDQEIAHGITTTASTDYWNVVLTFGKAKGLTLREVYEEHLDYFDWLAGKWLSEKDNPANQYYSKDLPLINAIKAAVAEVDAPRSYDGHGVNISLDDDEIPY